MQWLRWWHNTVSDPKWINVARKANASVGQVVSVWAALLEHASQASPRGSLDGFHEEDTDAMFGYEPGTTFAIMHAMGGRGVLDPERNSIARWDERQPKRDDDSAERVRRHRTEKRDVTHCNAPATQVQRTVTHGNAPDTDTDTEKSREEPPAVAGGAGGNDTDIRRLADYVDQVTGGAWGYQARNQYLSKTWPVDSWLEAWRRVASMPKLPGKPWPYVVSIINGWEGGIPPAPTPTLKLAEPRPTLGQRLDEKQARMAEAFANWGKEAASA